MDSPQPPVCELPEPNSLLKKPPAAESARMNNSFQAHHHPEHVVNATVGMSTLHLILQFVAVCGVGLAPGIMFVVGAIKFGDAPCDQNLVGWFWGLAITQLLLVTYYVFHQLTQVDGDDSKEVAGGWVGCGVGCVNCFFLVWMIIGTVWYDASDDCDEGLKTWAFWTVLYVWLCGPTLICILCLVMICTGFFVSSLLHASGLGQACDTAEVNTQPIIAPSTGVSFLKKGQTRELIHVVSNRGKQSDALHLLRSKKATDEQHATLLGKQIEDMQSQIHTQSNVQSEQLMALETLHAKKKPEEEQSVNEQIESMQALIRHQSQLLDKQNEHSETMKKQMAAMTEQQNLMRKQLRNQNMAQLFPFYCKGHWEPKQMICIFAAWRGQVGSKLGKTESFNFKPVTKQNASLPAMPTDACKKGSERMALPLHEEQDKDLKLEHELERIKGQLQKKETELEYAKAAEDEKSKLIKQLQRQLDAYDRERAR